MISNCSSVLMHPELLAAISAAKNCVESIIVYLQVLATKGNYAYLNPAKDPNRIILIITISSISYFNAVQSLSFYRIV